MRPVPGPALALIARFEGLSLTPYLCPGGFWSVGYGHRCEPDHPPVTQDEAWLLLQADSGAAGQAVERLTRVPLTEHQFGALASFVFNLGAGAYQASTLRRRVNAQDFAAAAAEFPRWVHAAGRRLPGLIARRAAEAAMFRS